MFSAGILMLRSAGFQTCCIADFQVGYAALRPAGLETRGTADLEVCATLNRYPAATGEPHRDGAETRSRGRLRYMAPAARWQGVSRQTAHAQKVRRACGWDSAISMVARWPVCV